MSPTDQERTGRILLVDDDDGVREMMLQTLEYRGFQVVAASNVVDALKLITTECFDVLLTDLHMPHSGDGFTLITAMRHAQPDALTLLVSGYPDVQSAMATILLEADQIIVKPFDTGNLAELIRERLRTRKPAAKLRKERVAAILQRSVGAIVDAWLVRAKHNDDLTFPHLGDTERTGHLPRLVEDLAFRLTKGMPATSGSDACDSVSARHHGELRYLQGYTPAMLVQESRMLQVTIFEALQNNRQHLDFSLLLPDVMTIADEVDSQLTQAMDSYMGCMRKPAVA